MPAPLAGSANPATPPATSNSAARAPRSEGGKDFSQLLQDGAPSAPAPAGSATTPSPSTSSQPSTTDSSGQAPGERSDAEAVTAEAPPPAPVAVTPAAPATDKDKPAATEDAPWPPLGLAGLVLAMPTPVDPAAALPTTAAPSLSLIHI